MNNGERIEILIRALPYSSQIKNIDVSDANMVTFTWRGTDYVYSNVGFIEERSGGLLMGSDKSILIDKLIEQSKILSNVYP